MRLLFCCESYYPSQGGVQEVMRQIAERLAAAGHDVTVATSYLPERNFTSHNGVAIQAFRAAGNAIVGMSGELDRYRDFVIHFDADAVLIMAAQQWTFDALWPVLDRIATRKVFIPCGFSGLYEPDYAEYFRQLPEILRTFDHLIFNAEHYRDIDFVRSLGLTNFSVVPNGVSESEFEAELDPGFRKRFGVSDQDFVFLTVGNPIELKGHREVAEAFARLDIMGRPATLIMIARWSSATGFNRSTLYQALRILRELGPREFMKRGLRLISVWRAWVSWMYLIWQSIKCGVVPADGPVVVGRAEGRAGLGAGLRSTLRQQRRKSVKDWVRCANRQPGKRVLCADLARSDLVQAYMAADLFVFASRVEYSPLVLFEAGAAGTAFLSVPVGNAEEIVRWTGGGIICPADKDNRGYTRVNPEVLAAEMQKCMRAPDMLTRLGAAAKQKWRQQFTWRDVAARYEAILSGRALDAVPGTFEDLRDKETEAR